MCGTCGMISQGYNLDRQNICYTVYELLQEKDSTNIAQSMKSSPQYPNVLAHVCVKVQAIEPLQVRLVSDWVQTICLFESKILFFSPSVAVH